MHAKNSIEQIYQKKTQLEHVLLRPDTYVGSVEAISSTLWVLDLESIPARFVSKTIDYIPGLYKIFDEILVNAADNLQRDKRMDKIKVTINEKNNQISVWNNGKGIPIQIHKEHKIYVPELIFGHLLTSSNYDDSEKKVTGGRNGYGAKLTNIFSSKFTVETGDSKLKKVFRMTWNNNMSSNTPAEIKDYQGEDFTCVTFEPDLKRFKISSIDENMIALMQKRVYDLAGVLSSRIKVYLNGKIIDVHGFESYVNLYFPAEGEVEKICETGKNKSSERWEVIAAVSEGQFQQVSFVNSICTSKGGTHVAYITDQIVENLMEILKKKHKDLKIKPFQIKSHIWVFINSQIENPAFDSQTKETLTTKASSFGSTYEVSEKFIKDLLKTKILDQIVLQAKAKEQAKLAKTMTGQKKSRLLGIPKLEDANDAGTKNSESCTLILTEGDSAKSLAMAGIEVVGRDRYGVFPLKGKLLNVREATSKQSSENQELQHLIKILGLQYAKKYDSVKSLRYGSVMVMADQDYDGSHIKGLVINFFHTFWPDLVRMNGFVKEFVTPILKASKNNETKTFFTINDHKKWMETMAPEEQAKWSVKYYKGLGTSTNKEAKEYFERITRHQLNFNYRDNTDDDAVDLAFSKKRADDRKEWLLNYDPENTVDHSQKQLRYVDFVNQELIQFSYHDNIRSIPSMCDGLKPGQRKILFSCFKRNLRAEIKVAQLAGYVAEHSAYHHGENSLNQTIVAMAQNFVGSNNISLLQPIGQFGSRNMGGKDAASARYIFTNLSKITRKLFVESDDHLYDYNKDDGQMVEPKWYLPVIPLVLVNGAEGIGTGWSTNVPSYNPKEIAEVLIKKLENSEEESKLPEINPWFRGFKGEIVRSDKGYIISGKFKRLGDDVLEITELPIGTWTRNYKTFLEGKWEGNNESESPIEDIKEFHTGDHVDFVIRMKPGKLDEIESKEGIDKYFNMSSSISTKNMVLFDPSGKIKKYSSVNDILDEFYDLRLKYYSERKKYLISQKSRDVELLENKLRFVTELLDGTLQLKNTRKQDLMQELQNKGFRSFKNLPKVYSKKLDFKENTEESNNNLEEDDSARDYNYLLSLPIWALTYEKVDALKQDLHIKQKELRVIKEKTPEEFWIDDLYDFLTVFNEEFLGEKASYNAKILTGKQNFLNKVGTAAVKKKKNGVGSEDSDFECKQIEKAPLVKKVLSRKKPEKIKDGSDEEDYNSDEESKKLSKNIRKANEMEEEFIQMEQTEEKGLKSKKEKVTEKKEENKQAPTLKKFDFAKTLEKKPNLENNNNNNISEDLMREEKKEPPKKEEKKDPPKKEESNPSKMFKKPEPSQDKENKYSYNLDNSILKYLVSKPKPSISSLSNSTNFGQEPEKMVKMTLTERLQLREKQGDVKAFEEAYNHDLNTPIKDLPEIEVELPVKKKEKEKEKEKKPKISGKKRKATDLEEDSNFEEEDDIENLITSAYKKVKKEKRSGDEDDEWRPERAVRSAVKNRKRIIEEDDDYD